MRHANGACYVLKGIFCFAELPWQDSEVLKLIRDSNNFKGLVQALRAISSLDKLNHLPHYIQIEGFLAVLTVVRPISCAELITTVFSDY
jgi:hypothetical protein